MSVCLRRDKLNSIFAEINPLSVKVKMRFTKPLNRLSHLIGRFFIPLSFICSSNLYRCVLHKDK